MGAGHFSISMPLVHKYHGEISYGALKLKSQLSAEHLKKYNWLLTLWFVIHLAEDIMLIKIFISESGGDRRIPK